MMKKEKQAMTGAVDQVKDVVSKRIAQKSDQVADSISQLVEQVEERFGFSTEDALGTMQEIFGSYSDDLLDLIAEKTPLLVRQKKQNRRRQLVTVLTVAMGVFAVARWFLSHNAEESE